MKKILIVTPSFAIGGTNSSLFAFLSQVNREEICVDIFAMKHLGYYRDVLPNCHILNESVWLNDRILCGGIFKKVCNYIIRGIKRFLSLCRCNIRDLSIKIGGYLLKTQNYDAVLSYQEDFSGFISKLPAKKRIAWIRCEYDRYYEIHHHVNETEIYRKIDTVVCVSKFARNSFLRFYPAMDEKTVVIHNFMDVVGLREKAKEDISFHEDFDDSSFTIISIGRIDRVKQFEMIPLIAKKIKEKTDKPFKWYIIGGTSKDLELVSLLRQRINDNGLKNTVYLLGEITNINPYLSRADILVHTSKSETFSRVVNEAKALCVPPVINDYACATEFVKNGVDGYITNNSIMDDIITELMNNPSKIEEVRKVLQKEQYDNNALMKKIEGII